MCNPESISDKKRRRDAIKHRVKSKIYPGRNDDLDVLRDLNAEIAGHEQSHVKENELATKWGW